MRNLYACLILLISAVVDRADAPKGTGPSPREPSRLQEARQRWLHGNYEEARALFETLTKDPKQKALAVAGLSRSLESQGEYDKAVEVIDAALREDPASADFHARRAELLYMRGRWTDAEQAAEKV